MPYKEQERQREYQRQWQERRRRSAGVPTREAANPTATKDERNRRQSEIAKIKIDRGCSTCGYNANPAALHFHHTRGEKLFSLRYGVAKNYAWGRILAEIEKCDVLCANCHAEHHHPWLLGQKALCKSDANG